jgi:hypothetical protein
MLAVLQMIRLEYQSVEKFLMEKCRMSNESLSRIRKNLLITASADSEAVEVRL